MERINSYQVSDLMGAYYSIYSSQEDVQEEVLNEFGVNPGGQAALAAKQTQMKSDNAFAAKLDTLRAQRFGAGSYRTTPTPTAKPPSALQQGMDKTFKAGGGLAALAKGQSMGDVMKQGATNLKPTPSPSSSGSGAAPVRPVATTTTANTAPKPPITSATPKAAPGEDPMAIWTRTHQDLAKQVKPGQAGYQAIQKTLNPTTSTANQSLGQKAFSNPALGASQFKPTTSSAMGSSSQTAGVSATNKIAAMPKQPTMAPGAVKEDVDVYDIILSYLVAEGYADTNEAALAIMANMSEEWRNSIIC